MAVYQYSFLIIPDENVLHQMSLPTLKHEEIWEYNWWKDRESKYSSIESILSKQLPRIEWSSNTNDFKQFGNNETNDISISIDSNYIKQIHVRVDLSKLDLNFLKFILNFTESLDCLILDTENQIYSPTLELFSQKVVKSNAYRFVKNPQGFLDELNN